MIDFITEQIDKAHLVLIHFPIALLVFTVMMVWFAKKWNYLYKQSLLPQAIGTLAAIPTAITGYLDYLEFNSQIARDAINPHLISALSVTVLFLGLLIWRLVSIRKGRDIVRRNYYLVLMTSGMFLLLYAGYLGGRIVH